MGFPRQLDNRNFLAPVGFKFTLAKEPKVDFFSNSCRIPEISLGTAIQPSYTYVRIYVCYVCMYVDCVLYYVDREALCS